MGEAPGHHHVAGGQQVGPRYPQEQGGVRGGEGINREGTDVVHGHERIEPGGRTVAVLIGPRRIREDDVVEVSRHAGPPIHLSDSASAPTRPAQGRGYTTLGTPAAAPAGPEVFASPAS